jgi:hypothetical protein
VAHAGRLSPVYLMTPTCYAGEFNIIAIADRDTATPIRSSAHLVLRPPHDQTDVLDLSASSDNNPGAEERGIPGIRPIRRAAPLDQIATTHLVGGRETPAVRIASIRNSRRNGPQDSASDVAQAPASRSAYGRRSAHGSPESGGLWSRTRVYVRHREAVLPQRQVPEPVPHKCPTPGLEPQRSASTLRCLS